MSEHEACLAIEAEANERAARLEAKLAEAAVPFQGYVKVEELLESQAQLDEAESKWQQVYKEELEGSQDALTESQARIKELENGQCCKGD